MRPLSCAVIFALLVQCLAALTVLKHAGNSSSFDAKGVMAVTCKTHPDMAVDMMDAEEQGWNTRVFVVYDSLDACTKACCSESGLMESRWCITSTYKDKSA